MGRPGGIELRVHILWPLIGLLVLLAVAKGEVGSGLALWALMIYFASVTLHEFVRIVTASRVGGHISSVVLGPIGGLTKLHLPVDPPAHLLTALVGPMTYLVLLVAGGCGLAGLRENPNILDLMRFPFSPPIAATALSSGVSLAQIAQLTVWINWCLLLISFLPIDPCGGAELLRGILWPMVGRSTAASATSRIALGLAVAVALLAFLLPERYSSGVVPNSNGLVPSWFPLAVISVCLLYGGYRHVNTRRYDVGLAIDELDSDDEEWLLSEWDEDDREAVLVEHLQDKQQEAIDRKRREREAHEDERVDAILLRLRDLRLRDMSFEQLSDEDQATLKRASRRYRERRDEHHDED